jgi:hypothetical protein
MGRRVKQLTLILVLVFAVSVAASTAFAGGSSVLSGHTAQPPVSQSLGAGPAKKGKITPSTSSSPGTLPFTGADLGIAGAVALVLLAAGGTLRRAGRQKR